jgi:hypothetical protein
MQAHSIRCFSEYIIAASTYLFPVQVVAHERGKSREDLLSTSILFCHVLIWFQLTHLVIVLWV